VNHVLSPKDRSITSQQTHTAQVLDWQRARKDPLDAGLLRFVGYHRPERRINASS
jgi:hypothetical protein